MSFFKSFLLIFLFLFHLSSVKADELLPSSMIFFDYPGSTVLVVDKSYCRLMVYQFQDEWELKQSFSCTTGKKTGDKLREGDLKTPNGVYWLFKSWSGLELAEYFGKAANVYGVGSFELTYPIILTSYSMVRTGMVSGFMEHQKENRWQPEVVSRSVIPIF